MPRHVKEYDFNGLAGCVQQRRNRITGTLVGVYHGEQSGMESDPDNPWVTVCEDHGRIVAHPSLRLALEHAADPSGWCGDCNGNDPSEDIHVGT